MQAVRAVLLERRRHGAWESVRLAVPALALAQPGQYLALRCAPHDSFDPLTRRPAFITTVDPGAGTCTLLVAADDPACRYLMTQPPGSTIDVLGPLGKGWQVDSTIRTVALVGVAAAAPPLFALAHAMVARGAAVTVLIGAPSREVAPPPFLLPPAAEYNVAQSKAFAAAAVALLDDNLLRWADMLAIALPREYWAKVAQRVNQVRIRWSREFAQAAVLDPVDCSLACCVGVCGVCQVETRHSTRLACVDGPIFDLRDLVR